MSLKKDTFFTFLTQFPNLLLGIITGILITRILGPEGKGAYAIFNADVQLIVLFLGMGINTSIVYYASNNKIPVKDLMGFSLILLFGTSVLTFFLFFLGKDLFFIDFLYPDGYKSKFYAIYLVLAYIMNFSTSVITSVFRGKKLFTIGNWMSIVLAGLNFIFYTSYFLIRKDLPPESSLREILLINLVVLLVINIIWIVLYQKKIDEPIQWRIKWKYAKAILFFSGISYLAMVLNFFNYRLDLWIVEYYEDTATLGLYALAANIAQMLWMIGMPIGSVMFTYLASSNDHQYKVRVLTKFARLTFTTSVIIAIGSFFIADWIIPFVYGEEFTGSVLPFKILLIGIIFSTMNKIFSPFVIATGKVKYNLIATFVGVIFTIVLDILLIPIYGIVGASIATSASYISIYLVVLSFGISKLGLPLRNYFIISPSDIIYFKNLFLKKLNNGSK